MTLACYRHSAAETIDTHVATVHLTQGPETLACTDTHTCTHVHQLQQVYMCSDHVRVHCVSAKRMKPGNSPFCKQSHPGKPSIMSVNEHILDKQVWGAAVLQATEKNTGLHCCHYTKHINYEENTMQEVLHTLINLPIFPLSFASMIQAPPFVGLEI